MNPVIKIENLSKQYRLGVVGTGTLTHDLKRWYYRLRGWEDPYIKIGEANDRSTKGSSNYVWALKDINLEVMPGEILGIIGKNGAGKSTLLKILSKVTGPTTGSISYNGRIGSLLEVGTGFHQELTGRENIFLNGAILGMTKAEIKSRLDEIIDFSSVERYIDTPVKRYSSGMMVRLGFAVAAHLVTEILVVDEVLAVGDAEFQKKAIGKMQDVSRNEGRTVLFVSHNMQAVRQLCQRCIMIRSGEIVHDDISSKVIDYYLEDSYNQAINKVSIIEMIKQLPPDPVIQFGSVNLTQSGIPIKNFAENGKPLEIEISYQVFEKTTGLRIYFDFCDEQDTLLFRSFNDEDNDGIPTMEPGFYKSKAIVPANILAPISYELRIQAGIFNVRNCFPHPITIQIHVEHTSKYNRAYVADTFRGKFALVINWENSKKNS